jgi:hypothetical protein
MKKKARKKGTGLRGTLRPNEPYLNVVNRRHERLQEVMNALACVADQLALRDPRYQPVCVPFDPVIRNVVGLALIELQLLCRECDRDAAATTKANLVLR